jgi:hypothetical protein
MAATPAAAEIYELRTYHTNEGKLDALHARFRDHTLKLFEKHGMTVHQFWTPTEGDASKNTLIYLLSFPSKEARDAAWKAFGSDPEWKKVAEESQKDGQLLTGVDSVLMELTDYSPKK